MAETLDAGRRGFMFGAGAILFADPELIQSRIAVIHGDGVHDDWEGLQSLILGKPVRTAIGDTFAPGDQPSIVGGEYLISRTLEIPPGRNITMRNFIMIGAPGFRGGSLVYLQTGGRLRFQDGFMDSSQLAPWVPSVQIIGAAGIF